MIATVLTLLVAPAHAGWTLAPEAGLTVEHWGRAEGLPLDHVTDLALDEHGLLWVATAEGLWSFDGAHFMRAPSPLGRARIPLVAAHPGDGAIWALVQDRGLARLRDGEVTLWEDSGPAAELAVTLQEGGGALWSIASGGVLRLDEDPQPWPAAGRARAAHATAPGPDGRRFLATEQELVQLDKDGVILSRLGAAEGLPTPVQDLRLLRDGWAWVRAGTGAPWTYAVSDGQTTAPAEGALAGPLGCERGTWLVGEVPCPPKGDRGSGWQVGPAVVLRDGRPVLQVDPRIRVALEDATGALWLATNGDALLRVRAARVQVQRFSQDPRIASVTLDPAGRIWFGAYEGWWAPGSPPVAAMIREPEGLEWLGGYLLRRRDRMFALARGESFATDGGDIVGVREARPLTSVVATALDHRSRLWAADRWLGLFVFDGGDWTPWPPAGPSVPSPSALTAVGTELIVAMRSRGLARLRGDRLEPVAELDGHARAVRHLAARGRRLWASTEDEGLCVVPDIDAPTWTWRCVSEGQGLPAAGAHQSLVDGLGRTWVSTNHGIGVAHSGALEEFADGRSDGVHFLVLDTRHGLVSPEANGGSDLSLALDDRGFLWVPTQVGAAVIDTHALTLPDPPPVTLLLGPRLALEPGHEPITLAWRAVSLDWGPQVVYRTRLGEAAWSPPSAETSLVLAELRPGETAFEVQAGLAGVWGAASRVVMVRRPAFREIPWVPALAALGAGALVWAGDIARRRALQRRANQLEGAVAARTADVEAQASELARQRDLLASQAYHLQRLGEFKTRLIVNLHHELRTPLSLVLAPLRDPDATSGDLDLARRNAEKMGILIGQLADIAHMEAGTTRLAARWASLTELASECARRHARLAEDRGVSQELVTSGSADAWFDPGLLDKAISNLVHNAIKFSDQGGRVVLRVHERSDAMELVVDDEGPGVPEAERARIFERLHQVDRGDGRAHEGSGLGLAIATEVMELHGGEIGLRSRAGGGSAFWLSLPRGGGHLAPADIALDGPSAGRAPLAPAVDELGGDDAAAASSPLPTLLIVEDNRDMREYLAGALRDGRRVLCAEHGAQGLATARAQLPDIIVSDVMMPSMDGLSMLRALRADPRTAHIPVVLVSAKDRDQDRAEGLELADAWLTKPFYMPELRAHVHRLLRQTAGSEATADPLPEADRTFAARLEAQARTRLSDETLGLADLARAVGMSERSLQRRMDEVFGTSVSNWLRELRLAEACAQLRRGQVTTVGEAAAAVGMSRSYFSRAYKAWCGRAPGEDIRERAERVHERETQ